MKRRRWFTIPAMDRSRPESSLPTQEMEMTTMGQAMQLHARILKTGSPDTATRDLADVFTFSALSGNLTYARRLLSALPPPRDSYFHNTLIRAYSASPTPAPALLLFLSMHLRRRPAPPDAFTFPFVLRACARSRQARVGKQLHALLHKSDLTADPFVQNSLIHFYCVCGDSGAARKVFDQMPAPDVVSWTSLIDGLVDDGRPLEALKVFDGMLGSGIQLNDAAAVSVLRACASTGALSVGERVDAILEEEAEQEPNVTTAMIDMYAKCGRIEDASRVFREAKRKNVFTWTAMIAGLACHGMWEDAAAVFGEMQERGVKPDGRTMTAILSACRNSGRVDAGCGYFETMGSRHGVTPSIHHYGVMADLLGRSGWLDEAEAFVARMPVEPDAVVWRSLAWASGFHGDADRCERIARERLEMECGSLVLAGNALAAAGRWAEKGEVRRAMGARGVAKPAGHSRIEVEGEIHEFRAGDSSQAEAGKIYAQVVEMEGRLREEGYRPLLSLSEEDIDDDHIHNFNSIQIC